MQKNLSSTDRIVRTTIGAALVGYGMMRGKWIGVLGLYPLITGIAGTCLIYNKLGISTLKPADEDMMLEEAFEEQIEVAAP